MRALFLPGPFAEEDMLGAVLGGETGILRRARVTLPGYALFADPGGARLALAVDPWAEAAGAVVEVGLGALERLAFLFAAFGAAEQPAMVELSGTEIDVYAAQAAFGERFAAAGGAEWRSHLVEAAAEAIGLFGLRPAGSMAGLMQGISYRALARVRGRAEAVRGRSGFRAGDVDAIGLAQPYAKYFAVEEHRLRHRRYDGRMSGIVERAVFASGDAVTVVPFDPGRRRVLLIEQFRIGPYARRDPAPWRLEAVAGRCDAGEEPEASARREAREEAGVKLGRMIRIAGYYTSPGMLAEHVTAYVGEADLEGAGGVHGVSEEDEDIRAVVLPLADALDLVATGEVNNGPLLVSLLWLAGQAERLAAEWA